MRLLAVAGILLTGLMAAAAEVPRQAPEYAFNYPGGRQDLLSKYKGKVVALEFLFTTCPHCQTSARTLSKLQREYGSKGFQAIGVAINPNPDIASFTQQYATGFPVATGTRDSAMSFLQHSYMAPNFYVPQMVFIDKKGVIRGQYGGTDPFLGQNHEANMRGMIEKLLAEGGGSTPAKAPAKAKSTKKSS